MRHVFQKFSLIFLFLHITEAVLEAGNLESQEKKTMIQDLEIIKHHFEVGYAPMLWKKESVGWELEHAFTKAKERILSTPLLTTKQFQGIVRQFMHSAKDYHVNVIFFSTETSTLPFRVKGANGRYFIDWIDSMRLPSSRYAISKGDELLEFDGRPIIQVLEELKNEIGRCSNPNTDQRLTEIKLTNRSGMSGDIVPKGPITIKTRSIAGKENIYQLHWAHKSEHVKNPLDFFQSFNPLASLVNSIDSLSFTHRRLPIMKMANPIHEMFAKKNQETEGELGGRKSFVPVLGEIVWMYETDAFLNDDEDEDSHIIKIRWNAYIYRHPKGQNIGYIRIPHYMGDYRNVEEFGEILAYLQQNTDALVIDQVHNFGGLVEFQYQLASMFVTNEPFTTPYHQIKITQKEVWEAYKNLELIHLIDLTIQNENYDSGNNKDSSSKSENTKSEGFNYQWLLFVKSYFEFLLTEWEEGRSLTRPTPIIGVDRVNPHPKYQYSKPILMLIDEMDFSGGDFMPAILQDNKRVVLFGSRTAGAGGFVFGFEFPNNHGIAMCTYTASIAERKNSQKIENVGVTPDIAYEITEEDLQDGYQGYAQSVNQAISDLLAQ